MKKIYIRFVLTPSLCLGIFIKQIVEERFVLGSALFAPSKAKLEKIASLELLGLQVEEISRLVNLTSEQVISGTDSEEYKQIKVRSIAAQGIKERELRDGWNGVERKALKTVLGYLDSVGKDDPEFALKAANTAVNARARGEAHYERSHGNRPLPISLQGNVLVLTVHQNFATAIVSGEVPMRSNKVIEHQKREDALPPGRVDEFLLDSNSRVTKVSNMQKELDLMWEEAG